MTREYLLSLIKPYKLPYYESSAGVVVIPVSPFVRRAFKQMPAPFDILTVQVIPDRVIVTATGAGEEHWLTFSAKTPVQGVVRADWYKPDLPPCPLQRIELDKGVLILVYEEHYVEYSLRAETCALPTCFEPMPKADGRMLAVVSSRDFLPAVTASHYVTFESVDKAIFVNGEPVILSKGAVHSSTYDGYVLGQVLRWFGNAEVTLRVQDDCLTLERAEVGLRMFSRIKPCQIA